MSNILQKKLEQEIFDNYKLSVTDNYRGVKTIFNSEIAALVYAN